MHIETLQNQVETFIWYKELITQHVKSKIKSKALTQGWDSMVNGTSPHIPRTLVLFNRFVLKWPYLVPLRWKCSFWKSVWILSLCLRFALWVMSCACNAKTLVQFKVVIIIWSVRQQWTASTSPWSFWI